jgi:hypothetical protein
MPWSVSTNRTLRRVQLSVVSAQACLSLLLKEFTTVKFHSLGCGQVAEAGAASRAAELELALEEVRMFPECSNVHSTIPKCSLNVP